MALSVAENLLICVRDNWNNVSKAIKAMTDVVKNNRKKKRTISISEWSETRQTQYAILNANKRNHEIMNVSNDGDESLMNTNQWKNSRELIRNSNIYASSLLHLTLFPSCRWVWVYYNSDWTYLSRYSAHRAYKLCWKAFSSRTH